MSTVAVHRPSVSIIDRLGKLLQRNVATFIAWRRRRAGQNQLARMPETQLRDIGVTRADIHQDGCRVTWIV